MRCIGKAFDLSTITKITSLSLCVLHALLHGFYALIKNQTYFCYMNYNVNCFYICGHVFSSCPILLWKKLFHCLIAVAGSKAINSSQLLVNEMIILGLIIEYKEFYSYFLVGLITTFYSFNFQFFILFACIILILPN